HLLGDLEKLFARGTRHGHTASSIGRVPREVNVIPNPNCQKSVKFLARHSAAHPPCVSAIPLLTPALRLSSFNFQPPTHSRHMSSSRSYTISFGRWSCRSRKSSSCSITSRRHAARSTDMISSHFSRGNSSPVQSMSL